MARTVRARRYAWETWGDQELLDMRICDLGLTMAGTWLEGPINKLYHELEARGLRFRPHIWLSSEWFSPDGVPGFAVPFYLAHPRLIALERKQMQEAEGGNLKWCMKLLRHETGHALQNAFGLHRRKRWQQTFGKSSEPYPDWYQPQPSSKDFVLHLYDWYAQCHPAEDFAETFAVWLKPRSRWRTQYANWPALNKLTYVDEVMTELVGKGQPVRNRERLHPVTELRQTLREHYATQLGQYGTGYSDAYDDDLRHVFRPGREGEFASAFLRRNRRKFVGGAERWSPEHLFALNQVLTQMIGRCRELRLRVAGSEQEVCQDFTILLTMRAMQHVYTSCDRYAV